jgi:hypothetical protein
MSGLAEHVLAGDTGIELPTKARPTLVENETPTNTTDPVPAAVAA